MPDLHRYLALTDLASFFENARGDDDFTEEWRQQYFADMKRIIHPALIAFFKELKAEGRLVAIPNSEGYGCRLWNAWNEAASLTVDVPVEVGEKVLDQLACKFAHHLTHHIVSPYERVLRKEGAAAAALVDKSVAFDQVLGEFNAGTYPSWVLSHENCWNTDLSLALELTQWAPQGCYFDGKRFAPVLPLAPATLQETVVEFKTGNLLVADWFRINEFTDITREQRFSLNSRKGCEDQADYFATQFGVVSVCVGNTCPGVFQARNEIVVGCHYEDDGDLPARFSDKGKVCTDLWAVTFVEYETLVELVARKVPETAKQIVDAYLAENDDGGSHDLHRLTVEPGTYYLYHFGDYEEFGKMAVDAGLTLDTGAIQPYFVLSKVRLRGAVSS